jgi:diguanylate cyclase (GGDEF)-like protein/PAS domain S-box-containing protein
VSGLLRGLRSLASLQLALALLVALSFLMPSVDPDGREDFIQYAYLVIGAPTVWMLFAASRDETREVDSRAVWRDLALAAGSWWLGDVLTASMTVARTDRAGLLLVSDVAYLVSYPLAMRALAQFPGLGASRATRLRVQLDVVVACLTLAALFYWFAPLEAVAGGSAAWARDLLDLTYPIGDGMLLTGTLLVIARQNNPDSRRVVQLLAVSFGIRTAANLLFARPLVADARLYSLVTDTAWILWYGVLSWAAASGRALRPATEVPPRRQEAVEWLPWLCVSTVAAVLTYLVLNDQLLQARGVSVGMFALLLTVLLRQIVVNQEQREIDRALVGRDAEQRLAALVRHSSELIMVVDSDGLVRFVSATVDRVLGRDDAAVLDAPFGALMHPEDQAAFDATLTRLRNEAGASDAVTCRLAHGGGGWRWMEIVCTNGLDAENIDGFVLNLRDVTERRELEGQLEWQAFHDPMTGLANRVLFSDRVTHALTRRERAHTDLGVLFIDLDQFKSINDTLGHHAGDSVLRETARRIVGEVRGSDTVARLGGDEFAVLLEGASEPVCLDTANRLLQQLTRGFTVEGKEVFTGASIGVAVAEPGTTIDELIGRADVAMYVAKAEGRKRVVRFESHMRERATERLLLEADLRKALDQGELSVHYQPQVDLQTGEVLGAEALLRWTHPIRGIIPPSKFVPIAEQAGLVVEMSRFVLQTACRDAANWRLPNQQLASLHVAVNLSGRHLQDPGVIDDVHTALADANLDPALLTVEITESVMMRDTESAIAVLRRLKAINITVAIDDFGTGYSSLSYLQQFPIDVLKIDKSFIDKLGGSENDDSLARAILRLGDALGMATVAEGIETQRQLEQLQALGCLLGQGFLLCRPLPARTFHDVLVAGDLERLRDEVPPRRGVSPYR